MLTSTGQRVFHSPPENADLPFVRLCVSKGFCRLFISLPPVNPARSCSLGSITMKTGMKRPRIHLGILIRPSGPMASTAVPHSRFPPAPLWKIRAPHIMGTDSASRRPWTLSFWNVCEMSNVAQWWIDTIVCRLSKERTARAHHLCASDASLCRLLQLGIFTLFFLFFRFQPYSKNVSVFIYLFLIFVEWPNLTVSNIFCSLHSNIFNPYKIYESYLSLRDLIFQIKIKQ